MEPRFTRGEYWLLEIAVEHEWSISGLIDSELELHLNKKGHGLTRASLLKSLYRLRFQARDKREEENAEPSPPPSMEYFYSVWCAWR